MLRFLCMVSLFAFKVSAQQKWEFRLRQDTVAIQQKIAALQKAHPVTYAYLMLHCLNVSEKKYVLPAYWGNNQLEVVRQYGLLKLKLLLEEGVYMGVEEQVNEHVRNFMIDEYKKSPVIQSLSKKLQKALNSYFMIFIDLPIDL